VATAKNAKPVKKTAAKPAKKAAPKKSSASKTPVKKAATKSVTKTPTKSVAKAAAKTPAKKSAPKKEVAKVSPKKAATKAPAKKVAQTKPAKKAAAPAKKAAGKLGSAVEAKAKKALVIGDGEEELEIDDVEIEIDDVEIEPGIDLAAAAVLEVELGAELEKDLSELDSDDVKEVVAPTPDAIVLSDVDEGDEPQQTVMTAGATADPVKDYLKQIGKVALLNAEDEVNLAMFIEAGLLAKERYGKEGEKLKIATGTRSVKCTNCKQVAKRYTEFHLLRDGGKIKHRVCILCIEEMIAKGENEKEHLLNANLRLVVSLAKRYTGRGMLFLDLIQEGNLGLIRAVEKFDFKKGYKFSTYATWWIRQAITRAMADQARTIRIPVHMVEVINKLARVQRQMLQDLGREPTPEELARELDMTPEKVVEVQKYGREPISLHTPLGEEGDSEFGDLIEDSEAIVPADAVAFRLLQDQLEGVLDTLSDRESGVVRMRFGLTDGQPKTLDEIGKVYGVTRERIRQIESKTMSKLRHPSRSQSLRDYLD